MRSQSMFEKMAQGTSQNAFAVCLVVLRIAAGLAFIYFAVHLMQMTGVDVSTADPGSASYDMQVSDLQAIKMIFGPLLFALGALFVSGLLVRPVSVLAVIFLVYNALTSGSINPQGVFIGHGLMALGFCVFAAAGSSHVLGLDGIISRNIRRPNPVTKFLFG